MKTSQGNVKFILTSKDFYPLHTNLEFSRPEYIDVTLWAQTGKSFIETDYIDYHGSNLLWRASILIFCDKQNIYISLVRKHMNPKHGRMMT